MDTEPPGGQVSVQGQKARQQETEVRDQFAMLLTGCSVQHVRPPPEVNHGRQMAMAARPPGVARHRLRETYCSGRALSGGGGYVMSSHQRKTDLFQTHKSR